MTGERQRVGAEVAPHDERARELGEEPDPERAEQRDVAQPDGATLRLGRVGIRERGDGLGDRRRQRVELHGLTEQEEPDERAQRPVERARLAGPAVAARRVRREGGEEGGQALPLQLVPQLCRRPHRARR